MPQVRAQCADGGDTDWQVLIASTLIHRVGWKTRLCEP
jgi:hypothetical protein